MNLRKPVEGQQLVLVNNILFFTTEKAFFFSVRDIEQPPKTLGAVLGRGVERAAPQLLLGLQLYTKVEKKVLETKSTEE